MNERIKTVRKSYNLNQQEFGERIGVKQTTVANYESGSRTPIDAIVFTICREFGVSESWLRDGVGEMYAQTPNTTADKLVDEYGLDDFAARFVREYMALDEEKKKVVRDFVSGLAASQRPDPAEDDIDAKVERYRASLESEKRRASPASSGGGSSTGESEGIA